MDLQILDNIIENDDVIQLKELFMNIETTRSKTCGYSKEKKLNNNNVKKILYDNIEKYFKIDNSRHIDFFKRTYLCDSKYSVFPNYVYINNIDIICYIISYKNNNNVRIYDKIISYILEVYSEPKLMNSQDSILKKILCLISFGKYPSYVFDKFRMKYFPYSINYQDEIFMSLAINSTNLQIIIHLIDRVNIWKILYERDCVLIELFKYVNHNKQKNLKKILKKNIDFSFIKQINTNKTDITINEWFIINITKTLLYNGQYNLIKIFYENNILGDWKTSLYIGLVYIGNLNVKEFSIWIKNQSHLDKDSWLKLLFNVYSKGQHYDYRMNTIYDTLLYYCPYKSNIFSIIQPIKNVTILDYISSLKNGYKILSKYDEYIKDWDNIDIKSTNLWSPLLNACRYSDFSTFCFLYHKSNLKNILVNNDFMFDILSCAFRNADDRIYKFIINNIGKDDDLDISMFQQNILVYIEAIINSKLKMKFIKKRLLDLNNFENLQCEIRINYMINELYPNLYPSIDKLSWKSIGDGITDVRFCFENDKTNCSFYGDNIFEWLIYNFPIQNIYPRFILYYILENDFNKSIILIKKLGYNIFKLLEYCLCYFDWENVLIQMILVYTPNLECINLENQTYIMNGLIQRWKSRVVNPGGWSEEEINESLSIEINNILTILIDKRFDFENIRITNYYDCRTDIPLFIKNNCKIVNYLLIIYNNSGSSLLIKSLIQKGLFYKCFDIHNIPFDIISMERLKPIINTFRFLNRWIIKRTKINLDKFHFKYKCLVNEFLNHSGIHKKVLINGGIEWRKIMVKYGNIFGFPSYNLIEDCCQSNLSHLLNCDNIIITQQIQNPIQTILPSNINPKLNIQLNNIKAEYNEDLDVYSVFDVCEIQCSIEKILNTKITPLIKNTWLREIHDYTFDKNTDNNFSIINLEQEKKNFKEFIYYERNIKQTKGSLWYPKKVWNFEKKCLTDKHFITKNIQNEMILSVDLSYLIRLKTNDCLLEQFKLS